MIIITAQKMKFSIKNFFSFLRIWLHLLKKSLMENYFFLLSECDNIGKTLQPRILETLPNL